MKYCSYLLSILCSHLLSILCSHLLSTYCHIILLRFTLYIKYFYHLLSILSCTLYIIICSLYYHLLSPVISTWVGCFKIKCTLKNTLVFFFSLNLYDYICHVTVHFLFSHLVSPPLIFFPPHFSVLGVTQRSQ